MAQTFFVTATDGERVQVEAFSLAEYEEMGGSYDDSGNGGESVDPSEFVTAIRFPNGDSLQDVTAETMDSREAWCDSLLDCYLFREWPDAMPLEVRVNVAA